MILVRPDQRYLFAQTRGGRLCPGDGSWVISLMVPHRALFDVLATWRERAANVSGAALPCGHFQEAPDETALALESFFLTSRRAATSFDYFSGALSGQVVRVGSHNGPDGVPSGGSIAFQMAAATLGSWQRLLPLPAPPRIPGPRSQQADSRRSRTAAVRQRMRVRPAGPRSGHALSDPEVRFVFNRPRPSASRHATTGSTRKGCSQASLPVGLVEPPRRKRQTALVEGFSLHGGVHLHANDREGLEKLCGYGAKPPFALERLSVLPDGRVCYRLRRLIADGRTELLLAPTEFLRKPPPGSLPRRIRAQCRLAQAGRAVSRTGRAAGLGRNFRLPRRPRWQLRPL